MVSARVGSYIIAHPIKIRTQQMHAPALSLSPIHQPPPDYITADRPKGNRIPVTSLRALLLVREVNSWEKPSTNKGIRKRTRSISDTIVNKGVRTIAKAIPIQRPVHREHKKLVCPFILRQRSSRLWQIKNICMDFWPFEKVTTGPARLSHLKLRQFIFKASPLLFDKYSHLMY